MLCRVLSINFLKKNISSDILGKINKKCFSCLVDFGQYGGGLGEGLNLLKKYDLGRIFFSDNIE